MGQSGAGSICSWGIKVKTKVRGREGRATEWAQSERPLEIRNGFGSVVSTQQLLDSVLNLTACILVMQKDQEK